MQILLWKIIFHVGGFLRSRRVRSRLMVEEFVASGLVVDMGFSLFLVLFKAILSEVYHLNRGNWRIISVFRILLLFQVLSY